MANVDKCLSFVHVAFLRRSLGEDLGLEEVFEGLAAADESGFAALDEDLGGAGAGVVVGAEGHAVGAGVEDEDEVARLHGGRARSRAKKSPDSQTGPTTSTFPFALLARGLLDGQDLVVGLVERGADEVVHAGVGDDEGLGAVLLDVKDAGEQAAGLGDDEAAGLEEQAASSRRAP